MGKFDGILLVTDLDGTLLRADKSVSRENKAAIEYFTESGGIFTFITGRCPQGVAPVLEQITPVAPIGCMNGGGIYDIDANKYLWKRKLDLSALEMVREVDERFPEVGIELFGFEQVYIAKSNASTDKHREDERLADISCDYRNPPEDVAKVLFAAKSEWLAPLEKALRAHYLADGFDFIRSDEEYFEILPKGSCKGNLLTELANILGVPRERTIAVGDNDNDASMLEAAGIGIAVANASESAKRSADIITVSNEEHAIAKIIKDIESGKININ